MCPTAPRLPTELCLEVSRSLNLGDAVDLGGLHAALKQGLANFERLLNNIKAEQNLDLSLLGAPIDALFAGKSVFFSAR